VLHPPSASRLVGRSTRKEAQATLELLRWDGRDFDEAIEELKESVIR
jgi:hypothetical protein